VTQLFTCWTAGVGAADAARAGGKAAALGELARAGLPVPRGFVITTAALLLHMDEVDPGEAARGALGALGADDLAGIAAAAAGLRARVVAQALPPDAPAGPACTSTSRSPTAAARASARTAWPWASLCSGC
jgi:pyruvate,water dikinase